MSGQVPIASRECHGLPWGFPGQPVPVPVETRTCACTGFTQPTGNKTHTDQAVAQFIRGEIIY
jgi:hypothetical protein